MTRTPEFYSKVQAWLDEVHGKKDLPFKKECQIRRVMPGLLYRLEVAGGVVCSIVQLRDETTDKRAQNLTLVIEDTINGRWVSLKLSSFRRVAKFVEKMGMKESRRLSLIEQFKINHQEF